MDELKLSDPERISLFLQYKVLSLLDPTEPDIYKDAMRIVADGIESEYHRLTTPLRHPITRKEATEVHDILDMYKRLSKSLELLGSVPAALGPGILATDTEFLGFDRSETGHFRFLLWLSQENPEVGFKEHVGPTLHMYRRMLKVDEQLKQQFPWSLDQIRLVLSEQMDPNYRSG